MQRMPKLTTIRLLKMLTMIMEMLMMMTEMTNTFFPSFSFPF